MEISFNIINEFLQLTYVKNLFKSYCDTSEEEDPETGSISDKESKKKHQFIKYLKKLNLNSKEFTPTKTIKEIFPIENSYSTKEIKENGFQKIVYRKKLRKPSEIEPFTLVPSEKASTLKTSIKERINGKESKGFVPFESQKLKY